jgi:hypothetical protein
LLDEASERVEGPGPARALTGEDIGLGGKDGIGIGSISSFLITDEMAVGVMVEVAEPIGRVRSGLGEVKGDPKEGG